MISKTCVWIFVIYRLVRLLVVLAVGTVNSQGALGHGVCSHNGRIFVHLTSLHLVSGARLQKFPQSCPPLLIFRLTKSLLLSVGPRRASNTCRRRKCDTRKFCISLGVEKQIRQKEKERKIKIKKRRKNIGTETR